MWALVIGQGPGVLKYAYAPHIIALLLGVTAYVLSKFGSLALFEWPAQFINWVKRTWKYESLPRSEVDLPSDFPRNALDFLVPDHLYRSKERFPIRSMENPTSPQTVLNSLVPFYFEAFVRLRWVKEEKFAVINPVAEARGEKLLPLRFLSSIEDMDGRLIKEMK